MIGNQKKRRQLINEKNRCHERRENFHLFGETKEKKKTTPNE
jgi:hypothetical protein